jgi:predicted GNAT superfamily acetyltransferase
MRAISYRDLTTLEEFAAVVQLERDIWGSAYDDVVPVPILAVSVHSGGILIGAFDDDRMIGFVYSLPGIKDGKPTQWSHMAGVLPEYQEPRPWLSAQAAAARTCAQRRARPCAVDL